MIHPEWEVSILKMRNSEGIFFKVTRRMPRLSVSETLILHSLDEVDSKLKEWFQ